MRTIALGLSNFTRRAPLSIRLSSGPPQLVLRLVEFHESAMSADNGAFSHGTVRQEAPSMGHRYRNRNSDSRLAILAVAPCRLDDRCAGRLRIEKLEERLTFWRLWRFPKESGDVPLLFSLIGTGCSAMQRYSIPWATAAKLATEADCDPRVIIDELEAAKENRKPQTNRSRLRARAVLVKHAYITAEGSPR